MTTGFIVLVLFALMILALTPRSLRRSRKGSVDGGGGEGSAVLDGDAGCGDGGGGD